MTLSMNEKEIRFWLHDLFRTLFGENYVICKLVNICAKMITIHAYMEYFMQLSRHHKLCNISAKLSLIARFMGPTWGPSGADRTHVGPMLAPWTLLSGTAISSWSYRSRSPHVTHFLIMTISLFVSQMKRIHSQTWPPQSGHNEWQ